MEGASMAGGSTLPPLPSGGGSSSLIEIKVKEIMTREEVFVQVGLWDTISILKKRVESKGLGPVQRQRLVHAGRILGDEETITQAGLQNNPNVVLALRKLDSEATSGTVPLVRGAPNLASISAQVNSTRDHLSALGGTHQQNQSQSQNQSQGQNSNQDVPSCRICHESDNEEQGDWRLFSPCLCRGSVRYVHVGCLNRWRALSANPRSYYQCDACGYKYSMQRTAFANYCHSYKVQEVATILSCLLLVAIFGLISRTTGIEWQLYKACEWHPQWHGTHWAWLCDLTMCGLICVGLIGFVLAAWKAYQDDARNLSTNLIYLLAAHGTLAIRLLCFVGLLNSLKTVHTRVQEYLKEALSKWGDAILEVQASNAARNEAS